jgi:hypothetical protein
MAAWHKASVAALRYMRRWMPGYGDPLEDQEANQVLRHMCAFGERLIKGEARAAKAGGRR